MSTLPLHNNSRIEICESTKSITLTLDDDKSDPCQPDPCGPGALASASSTGGCSCSCPLGLRGDPRAQGCRPECLINADCPRDQACSSNTCTDPCPGTCGAHATCSVINHIPTCVCDKGHVGNAFEECVKRKHEILRNFQELTQWNSALKINMKYDTCATLSRGLPS